MSNVWPFCPLRDYIEERQWLTDVINVVEDEVRYSVRETPRIDITYNYLFTTAASLAIATRRAKAYVNELIGIPLWSLAVRLGSVATGTTVITIDTVRYDLSATSTVFIYQGYGTYHISTLNAITTTSITLTSAIPTSAFTNCFIMPLVYGYLTNGLEFIREIGSKKRGSVTFTSTTCFQNSTWPYSFLTYTNPYKNSPVLENTLIESFTQKYYRTNNFFDSSSGDFIR